MYFIHRIVTGVPSETTAITAGSFYAPESPAPPVVPITEDLPGFLEGLTGAAVIRINLTDGGGGGLGGAEWDAIRDVLRDTDHPAILLITAPTIAAVPADVRGVFEVADAVWKVDPNYRQTA